jgi:NADPH-dependent 7-cyano-7-deazaguanine reductase QueF
VLVATNTGSFGDERRDESPMLGRQVAPSEYGRLDVFPVRAPVRVRFVTDELQALCPAVEGIQPDIYRAELTYTAVTHAIESKSLKLWLVTFRERRIFAEELVIELHDGIAALGDMVSDISVMLRQNIRGGIATEVTHPA